MAKQAIVTERDQKANPTKRDKALKRLADLKTAYFQVGSSMAIVQQMMLDFDDEKLWEILGYPSLPACIRSSLGLEKSQTYRLIAAAKVHRNLLPEIPKSGENVAVAAGKLPISEHLLRPIVDSDLGSKDQKRAWKQAMNFAARDSKTEILNVRPKHVKEAVAELTGVSPVPNPLTKKERMAKLREHILKAIGLADLLAVDSSVGDRLNEALAALDK